MRHVGALTILLGALGACAIAMPPTEYDMPLVAVNRPTDVENRWGPYELQLVDTSYTYEDQLMQVAFVPSDGTFWFRLQNKSEHSIQLVWDEMAYVGPSGLSSGVASGETRMMDVGQSRPPSVVPPGASLVDLAIPTTHLVRGLYGHTILDFVPADSSAGGYEGKEIRLTFPVRVRETVNEYTFVFTLKNVRRPTPPARDS